MKINFTYKILLFVSAMSALCSCGMADMNVEEPSYEDDEVYVDVELSGEVVYAVQSFDEEGNPIEELIPIENIGVSLLNSGDECYTNQNGRFLIVKEDVHIGRKPKLWLNIMFNDLDGNANGGAFKARTISKQVEFLVENRPLQVDIQVILEKETNY